MLDPEVAVRAIEENESGFLLGLGRAGGGEERLAAGVRWTIGGSPVDYHNAVFHVRLTAEEADAQIDASVERFRAHGVPGSWHLSPLATPPDMGSRLKARGFTGGWWDIGMAVELDALPERVPVDAGVTIEPVRDRAGLDAWTATRGQDPDGLAEARWTANMYERIGLGYDSAWRTYLAWLGGDPVATATTYVADGVVGLYFVLTVPAARRRGIGAAITLRAMRDALARGCHTGVLGASEMGLPVYKRLGFQEYGRFVVYEWHPPAHPAEKPQTV